MTAPLREIEIFVHVAEFGSFTRAARALSLTVSAVSRAVARLEEHLGARLMHRTTRRLTMTREGQTFFERCKHALVELHEAESHLAELQDEPRGAIRASFPVALGVRCLMDSLSRFQRAFPGVELDVSLSDRFEDLVQERTDLALRIGSLRDSSLVTRRLGRLGYTLCASPAYLAARGTPRSPSELGRHNCIPFVYPETHRTLEWSFDRGTDARRIRPRGTPRFDNGLALVDAAIAGLGIIQTQTPLVAPAIEAGTLVPLLPAWSGPVRAVQLVYRREPHQSQALRALLGFLSESLPSELALVRDAGAPEPTKPGPSPPAPGSG